MNRARVAELFRALAEEFAAPEEDGEAWIDQDASPLGRRRHLELVRAGVLPASKDGRKRLVKRKHLEAYLATRAVVKVDQDAIDEREVARVVQLVRSSGRRSA